MVAAFRAAVDHLLVREHRAEGGAPVHGHFGDVGEPLLVELFEDPLRPLVVLGIGRVDLAVPVVAKAERLDLLAEAVHVLLRGDRGVRAGLHGVLLGGEAEGVPAHRVEDVEALHALVAAEDVRRRIALGVAYVKARPRRVGEHVETVELRLVRRGIRLERLVFQPVFPPFRFNGAVIVIAHFDLFALTNQVVYKRVQADRAPRGPPHPLSLLRDRWSRP